MREIIDDVPESEWITREARAERFKETIAQKVEAVAKAEPEKAAQIDNSLKKGLRPEWEAAGLEGYREFLLGLQRIRV